MSVIGHFCLGGENTFDLGHVHFSEEGNIHNCLGLGTVGALQPVLNQGRRTMVHINYNNVNVFVCQG